MRTLNFAECLLDRISNHSFIADASSKQGFGYEEIRSRVALMAAKLSLKGLSSGDRIVVGCELSPASALVYLAVLYAGMVAVPVESRVLKNNAATITATCSASAIVANDVDLPPSLPVLKISTGDLLDVEGVGRVDAVKCSPDDICVLNSTSGSSAKPRFVQISHGNLMANTEAIAYSQGLSAADSAMLILPIHYCFGASVLHSHLYAGGSVVFDRRFMFPDKVLNAIRENDCTTFAGVPTIYNILIRRSNLGKIPMPGLRRFIQAGGRLNPDTIRQVQAAVPGANFFVMYGQTEATARITTLDPAMLPEKLGSVGKPLKNLSVRIVSEHGRDMPVGETGEIYVKGPSISCGYWDEPALTREVFADGWLHTGDLAHFDEDGFIWIDGRKSDFIKVRGIRVSLTEVEDLISGIKGVEDVGVCSVAHDEAGEALAVSIVLAPGADFEITKSLIAKTLPAAWTCPVIRAVTQLPRTLSGKLSRAALSEQTRESHGRHSE